MNIDATIATVFTSMMYVMASMTVGTTQMSGIVVSFMRLSFRWKCYELGKVPLFLNGTILLVQDTMEHYNPVNCKNLLQNTFFLNKFDIACALL